MGDAAANDALQATLDSLAGSLKLLQTTVEANALAIQRLEAARAPQAARRSPPGQANIIRTDRRVSKNSTSHAMTASPIR